MDYPEEEIENSIDIYDRYMLKYMLDGNLTRGIALYVFYLVDKGIIEMSEDDLYQWKVKKLPTDKTKDMLRKLKLWQPAFNTRIYRLEQFGLIKDSRARDMKLTPMGVRIALKVGD